MHKVVFLVCFDSYLKKNALPSTVLQGSYLAHTQGKKHQTNL